ncbi:hypothetical protein J5X98_02810 [Leptothermofonsia sichuanensis E412]|uniref:hypothetical protein n=1 Tax=Leptothermofonsia sichuanensis TaxID=2917832 RepID=UPI001CA752E6|nr:hypothetical protein [Leptothermofonsia sichuanensis]QZZ21421.1 hypothetical protein J5X98_02810 [Leptothermofonsia sichuanensis E412]
MIGGEPEGCFYTGVLQANHLTLIGATDGAKNAMGFAIVGEDKIAGLDGFDGS